MDVLTNLLFGFGMTVVGMLMPGMINMTSVSVSLKRGLAGGLQFSAGAAVTIFLQALIAVTFAGFLTRNPEVILWLKRVAIAIFLILAVVFYRQARRPQQTQSYNRGGPAFLVGMGIASMNVLVIPYFLTFSAFLKANDYITLIPPAHWFFIVGAALGGLALLSAYAGFAQYIERRANFFARNINYFLAGLFVLLAVLQIVQLSR